MYMDTCQELLEAAIAYAWHETKCRICASEGIENCDYGMFLLKRFQDALNADSRKPRG